MTTFCNIFEFFDVHIHLANFVYLCEMWSLLSLLNGPCEISYFYAATCWHTGTNKNLINTVSLGLFSLCPAGWLLIRSAKRMSLKLSNIQLQELVQKWRNGVQPWSEFVNMKRFQIPAAIVPAGRRVVKNIDRFHSNYVAIFLGFTTAAMYVYPFFFLVVTSVVLIIHVVAGMHACVGKGVAHLPKAARWWDFCVANVLRTDTLLNLIYPNSLECTRLEVTRQFNVIPKTNYYTLL